MIVIIVIVGPTKRRLI